MKNILILFSFIVINCTTSSKMSEHKQTQKIKDSIEIVIVDMIQDYPIFKVRAKVINHTKKSLTLAQDNLFIGAIKFYENDAEIFDNEISPSGYPITKYTISLERAKELYDKNPTPFSSYYHARDYYNSKNTILYLKPKEEKEVEFIKMFSYWGHKFRKDKKYKASYKLVHSAYIFKSALIKEDLDSILNADITILDYDKEILMQPIKIRNDLLK